MILHLKFYAKSGIFTSSALVIQLVEIEDLKSLQWQFESVQGHHSFVLYNPFTSIKHKYNIALRRFYVQLNILTSS